MDKQHNIWTIQLAQWRKAKKLKVTLFNITAQSGIRHFSPEYNLVREYKSGLISDKDYTELYIQKMRKSLLTNPEIWESLLDETNICLTCYCPPNTFCHRHILKILIEKYLISKGHNVVQKGEIT
jgi:hypothetical protein